MEEIVKTTTILLSEIVELLAAIIIGYASLKEFIKYIRGAFRSKLDYQPDTNIRISLGKSLAIALELLLGADILRTAISPTWTEIGQLAAIAALRTALNYFLERDLRVKREEE